MPTVKNGGFPLWSAPPTSINGVEYVSSNNAVELKGGMYTFMSLRLRSSELDAIDAALADKVHQAPAFFKDTPVVVDLTDLEWLEGDQPETGDADDPAGTGATNRDNASAESLTLLDTSALLACIRRHKLQPVVASSSNKSSRLARSIALPLIEVDMRRRKRRVQAEAGAASDRDGVPGGETAESGKRIDDVPGSGDGTGIDGTATPTPPAADTFAEQTADDTARPNLDVPGLPGEIEYVIKSPTLVDRPVRSGQQIYARDTDLIIMGQVGPGAEVIADNNIHVYGPLRGRALCGVSGNTRTRIFCQSLEAELVSVAGTYRMLETIPGELRGRPAQIWLDKDRLNIEPL